VIKISRNSKCPCGSGKKYKQCCLAKTSSDPIDNFIDQQFSPNKPPKSFAPPVPPPRKEDNILRIQDFVKYTRGEVAELMRTNSMAEVEDLLVSVPMSHKFYLRYEASALIFAWRSDFGGAGQIQMDQGTGRISASGMSDVALYCFYQLFHRDPFFFPSAGIQKTVMEWWKKDNSAKTSTASQWRKEQIQQFDKIHKLLRGLFGPEKVQKACAIISFNDIEEPKGLSTKKLLSYPSDEMSSWGYVDTTMSILFSDGEVVKLEEPSHPYAYLLMADFAKYPARLSKELATLDPDSYNYNFLYNHLPYLQHLLQQENLQLVIHSTKKPKLGYIVSSLEILPKSETGWRFRRDEEGLIDIQGFVSSALLGDLRVLSEDVFVNIKTSALIFHQFDTTKFDLLNNLMAGEEKDPQACPGIKAEGHVEANLALRVLRDKGENVDLGEQKKLSCEDLKYRFHFYSAQPEAFGVELLLPSKVCLSHFPEELTDFLEGLNEGITACLDVDKEHWVSNRKGAVRQGELRLYRHRGLAIQILLKMLESTLVETEPSDKKFWAEFKADLGESLNRVVQVLKADNSFCSPRFEKLLKEIYAKIKFEKSFVIFTTQEEALEIPLKIYAQLLLTLLRYIAHSDLSCLIRMNGFGTELQPQFEELDFNDDASSLRKSPPSLKVAGRAVFPDLIPHLPQGAEVLCDGAPLDELKPEDLRSLVQLREYTDKVDWFELDPRFYFKGEEVSLLEALKLTQGPLVEFRGKFYRIDTSILPNIKWLEFLWNRLQGLQGKSKSGKSSGSRITLPRSASLEILALRAAGLQIDGGEQWGKICKEFDALSQHRDEAFVPQLDGVNTPLKDYQKTGVQWMLDLYQLHLGGILADDMGLGKTLQALSFFSLLQHREELGRSLVVVPTSLVYNWLSEINKFTPELKVQVFEASLKKKEDLGKGLILCSYGLFQRHREFFEEKNWNVVMFDEAQNLKNLSSLRNNIGRALVARSKFCLTGTPLENHYGEFYALIDLVVPGALGPYAPFMAIYGPKKGAGSLTPKDIDFLKLKTQPLVLRRDKKRVLSELPPKTENVILVPFEKQQEKIYREIAVAWNDRVRQQVDQKGEAQSQLQMLTALLRLRQVCSHPASLPNIDYRKVPPKVEMLIEQAEAILDKGESVLVFTNFVSTLHYIEGLFEKHHHKALTLHGGMTGPQRRKVLEEFENSEVPILLIMTLKTGGVGLNLTKANHVFHLEPWWNPAAENQGTDRVHRMGQEQHVHVVRFVMQNSIEEKIQSLKLSKTQCFDALFAESVEELDAMAPASFAKKQLTQADFEVLLNLDQTKAK
jgi:superfamily II DNA or RNA helicase